MNLPEKLRHNIDIILITLLSIVIGLWLYGLYGNRIEILAAIIASGISLSIGMKQYSIANDQIFKELFNSFNQKYNAEFNQVLNKIAEDYTKKP
ncbi:MAG: hypothetical protein ABIT06_02250, partial [Saprospiraceae bacterium]